MSAALPLCPRLYQGDEKTFSEANLFKGPIQQLKSVKCGLYITQNIKPTPPRHSGPLGV